ncbi:MAG: RluA family pseudouridine synthase [Balneolaceae bacterium]
MQNSTRTTPNIPIIYEDNHLLVIDKPEGVLSQEDRTNDSDVLTLCKIYIKKKYNKPGDAYLGLVHRLDQPVSGLMVLAKTSKAASRLSEQLRNGALKSAYWALVEGRTPMEGTLTHYLSKDNKTNFVRAFNSKKSGTKPATLKFETIKQSSNHSLVEVDLITGRPHQIRVQMAKIEFPLWGDYKYGEKGIKPGRRLGLRSVKLTFIHPTTKKKMEFIVNPPKQQPWSFFDY